MILFLIGRLHSAFQCLCLQNMFLKIQMKEIICFLLNFVLKQFPSFRSCFFKSCSSTPVITHSYSQISPRSNPSQTSHGKDIFRWFWFFIIESVWSWSESIFHRSWCFENVSSWSGQLSPGKAVGHMALMLSLKYFQRKQGILENCQSLHMMINF